MNPILELFQETLSAGENGDIATMLQDAREMLPFLGADLILDLKRCLRDRDIQIQLWTVELFDSLPQAHQQAGLNLLRRQLMVEERRTKRDNAALHERLQAMIENLDKLDVAVTTPSTTGTETNTVLLDMFQRVQNMDIKGGYARYQVETDMMGDARQLLIGLEDDLIPPLRTCLQYDDPQIQIWAVRLCETIPDAYRETAIDLLKQQLLIEDKSLERNNFQLRNIIKNTLAKMGDNSVVETAQAGLSPENDYDTRKQALVTLGSDANSNKDILLKIATEDEDLRIRQSAIRQLSKISEDESLIEVYEALYAEESAEIRASAIRAAMNSRVKDPRIAELAVTALDDKKDVMIEVIHGLEHKNMPSTVPKMMSLISEIKTGDVWQIARGLRSQVGKYKNLPDDWQPLYDLILNADDYPGKAFARNAVDALLGMPDLSAMPVLLAYMKRDATYEGDPERRPSFHVLHLLKNLRRDIEWVEYEQALEPYLTFEDEQFAVARIAIFAGEEDGYPLLERLRQATTSDDLIKFIDKHLPA